MPKNILLKTLAYIIVLQLVAAALYIFDSDSAVIQIFDYLGRFWFGPLIFKETRSVWVAVTGMILTVTAVALPLITFLVDRLNRDHPPWERLFLRQQFGVEKKVQLVSVSLFFSLVSLVLFPSYIAFFISIVLLLLSVSYLLTSYLLIFDLFNNPEKIRNGGVSIFLEAQETEKRKTAVDVERSAEFSSYLVATFQEFFNPPEVSNRGVYFLHDLHFLGSSSAPSSWLLKSSQQAVAFDRESIRSSIKWYVYTLLDVVKDTIGEEEFSRLKNQETDIRLLTTGLFGNTNPNSPLGIKVSLDIGEEFALNLRDQDQVIEMIQQLGQRITDAVLIDDSYISDYSFTTLVSELIRLIERNLNQREKREFADHLKLLTIVYETQFKPETKDQRDYSLQPLNLPRTWGEIYLAIESTEPPQSFLDSALSEIFDVASIAFKAKDFETFKWANRFLPIFAAKKWFMDKWEDYINTLALHWRDFAWINFRQHEEGLTTYFDVFLSLFQSLVHQSLDDPNNAIQAIESTHYLDQLEIHFRDWPDDYQLRLALPFIGIELILLSRLEKRLTEPDLFKKMYSTILDREIPKSQPACYALALKDNISQQFGWDFLDLDLTPHVGASWINVRGKVLMALSLRILFNKIDVGWESNLTSHDLSSMIDIVNGERLNSVAVALEIEPAEHQKELAISLIQTALERKNQQIHEQIQESDPKLELVEEFFAKAEESVKNYRRELVKMFRALQSGNGPRSDSVIYISLNKRFLLDPIDREHYALEADVYFRPLGDIEEFDLVQRLITFADASQSSSEVASLARAKSAIAERLERCHSDSFVGISVNLQYHERKGIEQVVNESLGADLGDDSFDFWDNRLPKGYLLVETPSLIEWYQYRLNHSDEQMARLIDQSYFLVELCKDDENLERIILKLRQNFSIEIDDSAVVYFVKVMDE